MKKCSVILWMAVAGLVVVMTATAQNADEIRQGVQMAVADAQKSLAASSIPRNTPISLLPVGRDQGAYVEGLLKNAVTAAGLTYVEGRNDPVWGEVLKEVEWDERKGDILDAATMVKFGKLKATKILMYGTLRESSISGQRIFVEIELHASSVETKQHLWGGTFAKRFYLPGVLEGIVSVEQLPPEVREVIKRSFFEQGAASLAKAEGKLKGIRTAALIPLAGDIDQYVTGLSRDLLAQTRNLYPKNLDAMTLAEARVILRDQPQRADALMHGAVRDVSQRLIKEWPLSKTYEVSTETQLYIESVTGEVLWSSTISAKGEYTHGVTVWSWASGHRTAALAIVLGIVGLLVVIFIINKSTVAR